MLKQSEGNVVAERDLKQARLADFALTSRCEVLSSQSLRVHTEEYLVYSSRIRQRATGGPTKKTPMAAYGGPSFIVRSRRWQHGWDDTVFLLARVHTRDVRVNDLFHWDEDYLYDCRQHKHRSTLRCRLSGQRSGLTHSTSACRNDSGMVRVP
jgi:hypothetical protein